MDWQTKMNNALDYIEENLAGEIKLDIAAKFAGCSVWEFQRLFPFVTHTSLCEYIRGRKLALAADIGAIIKVDTEMMKKTYLVNNLPLICIYFIL